MQGLAPRIKLPHCFGRKYRDVVTYIDSYTMEELGNLIWLGGIIAYAGPIKFQELWRDFQPAMQHYIFGHEDTSKTAMQAAASFARFQVNLERLVIDGWVCTPGQIWSAVISMHSILMLYV